MNWSHECECELCKKHKTQHETLVSKRVFQFHGIKEGDLIKVFSSGVYIGSGIFLGVENTMIIWINRSGNKFITHIHGITIKKVSANYDYLKKLNK